MAETFVVLLAHKRRADVRECVQEGQWCLTAILTSSIFALLQHSISGIRRLLCEGKAATKVAERRQRWLFAQSDGTCWNFSISLGG